MWVGLSFQAKMLEAWAVLPALGLLYVVSAPVVLRRRLAHLAVAGAVCVAVSASWVLLVTLTPAGDRPYVDGTTNNSAVSQVVGYNFVTRFSGLGISARDTGSVSVLTMAGTAPAKSSGRPQIRATVAQWGKMLGPSLASQVGWLYPAAALAAVCGPAWRRGRPRTDPLRAGFVLWGAWVAVYFLVFSAGAVGGHTYYMGVVAVPLAALFGAGMVQFWRAWRCGGRARVWALPTAVVSTVLWSAGIAEQFPSFLPWLAPAAITLAAGALALLGLSCTGEDGKRRQMAVLGLGVGTAAMLLPSAAWASSVLHPTYGHSGMGSTGPVATKHHTVQHRPSPALISDPRAAVKSPDGTSLSKNQRRLLAYTRAHQDGATYLFATTSWRVASPYVLHSGAKVLPMGGFTGAVPTPTGSAFRHLVATGRLRYVVLGGPATAQGRSIAPWVRAHCAPVPHQTPALYRCSPPSATSRAPGGR